VAKSHAELVREGHRLRAFRSGLVEASREARHQRSMHLGHAGPLEQRAEIVFEVVEEAHAFGDRRRPPIDCLDDVVEAVAGEVEVARSARMIEGRLHHAPRVFVSADPQAVETCDEHHQRELFFVSVLLEVCDGIRHQRSDAFERIGGIADVSTGDGSEHTGHSLDGPIAGGPCSRSRLVEQRDRPGEAPELTDELRDVEQQRQPSRRIQLCGSAEQRCSGRGVAPITGAPAGRRQMPCRSCGERLFGGSGEAELGSVAVALFEVMPDDLLELGEAIAGGLLEPGGELLVQRGKQLLAVAW